MKEYSHELASLPILKVQIPSNIEDESDVTINAFCPEFGLI